MFVSAELFLQVLALCLTFHIRVGLAAEPKLLVTSASGYSVNYQTEPRTIEIPYTGAWQLDCQWTRRNSSERPYLSIHAPTQNPCNCQFGTIAGPAGCTPSVMQFQSDSGGEANTLNVTCTEEQHRLTCSISLKGFNPNHIGVWSCKSAKDDKADTAFLQYYKTLPQESLTFVSLDPIVPVDAVPPSGQSSLEVNNSGNYSSNRFECFTKEAVIPPPRLIFKLGGTELTLNQTRYPIEGLTANNYFQQPRMNAANATGSGTPRQALALNQQLLAASRMLVIRLTRKYNDLVLECVAYQGLSHWHVVPARSLVLHLESSSASVTSLSLLRPLFWCWTIALATQLASVE